MIDRSWKLWMHQAPDSDVTIEWRRNGGESSVTIPRLLPPEWNVLGVEWRELPPKPFGVDVSHDEDTLSAVPVPEDIGEQLRETGRCILDLRKPDHRGFYHAWNNGQTFSEWRDISHLARLGNAYH